jgi:hypothetical protein
MHHQHLTLDRVVPVVLVMVCIVWPATVRAAEAGPHAEVAQPTQPPESVTGVIDAQPGTLNGQLGFGRGSAVLQARLTDTGPEGQYSVGASC